MRKPLLPLFSLRPKIGQYCLVNGSSMSAFRRSCSQELVDPVTEVSRKLFSGGFSGSLVKPVSTRTSNERPTLEFSRGD